MKRCVFVNIVMAVSVFCSGFAWEVTIEDLTKAIGSAPSDRVHTYYLYRSKAYFAMGDHENGLCDLETSIGLNPTAEAYTQRGEFFQSVNQYEHAIDDYSTALDLNKDYFKAYLLRSQAYYDNKEFGQAIIDASYMKMFAGNNLFAENMIEKCYIRMIPEQKVFLPPADVNAVMASRKRKRALRSQGSAVKSKPRKNCGPRRRTA